MFGWLKTKQQTADEKFKSDLRSFSSFFSGRVEFLNPRQNEELVATAMAVYLQRLPEDSDYTVCDFYFDCMTGNIIGAISQGALDKFTGLRMWKQTNRFLEAHPDFDRNNVAENCMINWKELLVESGVDRMNFDLP